MKEQYPTLLPKTDIAKAVAYAIKRWETLSRYTENGILKIDNNPVENSIRPVALGRKNYLFAGSHEAAKTAECCTASSAPAKCTASNLMAG